MSPFEVLLVVVGSVGVALLLVGVRRWLRVGVVRDRARRERLASIRSAQLAVVLRRQELGRRRATRKGRGPRRAAPAPR